MVGEIIFLILIDFLKDIKACYCSSLLVKQFLWGRSRRDRCEACSERSNRPNEELGSWLAGTARHSQ